MVYHFRPKARTTRLAIFHQGHSGLWEHGAVETVKFLLDRGFSVMAMQMPLMGGNRALAPPQFRSHDDLAKLISPDMEPLRFFLEPVVVTLNHARKTFGYEEVVMVGLSGGGWTTTLYAAIDPRVRVTLNVAAAGGEVRARLLRPDGSPLPGFSFADCRPITGDALDAPVQWKGPLAEVQGKPVRLEFRLQRAKLYAFSLR